MVLVWGMAQWYVQSLSTYLPVFPPCKHSGSHYSPVPWEKKSFGTQAVTTLRTKATCPDLQSAGSSKHRKGVNHLFFGDLDISSQQTWLWMLPWLLLWNHYSWMNLGVIYFQSVSFQYNLQVYKFSVLPNFQWLKRRQGTASLIQTFAGLLSIRSNQSVTSKYKNTVWRTYRGAVPWIWKT